jgi:hypothetical protein
MEKKFRWTLGGILAELIACRRNLKGFRSHLKETQKGSKIGLATM